MYTLDAEHAWFLHDSCSWTARSVCKVISVRIQSQLTTVYHLVQTNKLWLLPAFWLMQSELPSARSISDRQERLCCSSQQSTLFALSAVHSFLGAKPIRRLQWYLSFSVQNINLKCFTKCSIHPLMGCSRKRILTF